MNLTNLWDRAIKHSIFNRSVDGAPGAMRRAVRPFGQPRSAPPQPCPVRRAARGCSSLFPRRACLWRRLRARAAVLVLAALAAVLLGVPEVAKAQTVTLVSNNGQAVSGIRPLTSNDLAQAFDTGSNSGGYNLASIVLDFGEVSAGTGTLTVTVREDSSGNPSGTVLYTLTTPTLLVGSNEFLAPQNAELVANTTYWVVASYSAISGGPVWERVSLLDGLDTGAAAGWAIDASYKQNSRDNPVGWAVGSNGRAMQIAVRGSAQAVWTATLTPADLSGGILGCSNSVSTARCSSTSVLSEDSFNYDSTDYNISVLFVRSDGQFELELDAEFTTDTAADLTLVVGSTSLVLADGSILVQKRTWSSSGVSLTAGTDIAVKLTAPAPTDAAVLVSNFEQPRTGEIAFSSTHVVGTFMTGDSDARLTSIEFQLSSSAGIAPPSATLYTGSVERSERPDTLPVLRPGTMVATLTAPSTPLTARKQPVTYTTTARLAASTFYLVVLEITGLTGFIEVAYGPVDTGGASGWTIGGWAINPRFPYTYRTDYTLRIRINGTTVDTPPGAPTRLTATDNGPSRIDLAWTAPAGIGSSAITGYKIEYSPDGSSNWDLVTDTRSTATTYADMGLTAATTRHYRVFAINAVGTSAASNRAEATTAPPPPTRPQPPPPGRRSPPSTPPPPPGDVVGYLENPGAASFQSGIGLISGWTCDAEAVEIVLNGEPQKAAYGTARLDTEAVCGDSDNGFGLLFNWNLLGDGEHEVVALVDGVELDRATVTVTTLGTEFLRDVTGTCTATDFPTGDETVTLAWQQTQQNFVIVDGPAPAGATNRAGTAGEGYLENPGPNSYQSGIGVLSGWACEGEEVVIELNGQPQPAAYGTERSDTEEACGDTDNGFGLLFNWNLLGEGAHEVVAYVDGEELGRATVRVTTVGEGVGEEFLRDVEGECVVEDFPMPGETVTLEWQQNSQNFVITDVE